MLIGSGNSRRSEDGSKEVSDQTLWSYKLINYEEIQ
jgi:hypothetical protein